MFYLRHIKVTVNTLYMDNNNNGQHSQTGCKVTAARYCVPIGQICCRGGGQDLSWRPTCWEEEMEEEGK